MKKSDHNKTGPVILFICVHNSCRSQMAESLFNHYSEKGKAISAGSIPVQEIEVATAMVMDEIGIDMSGQKPKLLTQEIIKMADKKIIVCDDNSCPNILGAIRWNVKYPGGLGMDGLRKTRDLIKQKVIHLLKNL